MGFSAKYRLLLLTFCVFPAGTQLAAQLQVPGKPLGFSNQVKAAEVMYVLPPMDPLVVQSLVLMNQESVKKPLQFAVERQVDLSPETHGSWIQQGELHVWRVHILSPEAHSLGLVFNGYRLEKGVKVFVYDPDQLYTKGAFSSVNNKPSGVLAVGHLPGSEIVVEMQVPEGVAGYGVLNIESVSHAFLDLRALIANEVCPAGEFGCSQGCEIDINCSEGDEWQQTKKSVVRIEINGKYCTGVLVNNTSYDGTPYVLTAEHCINRPYDANRAVFLFNYESPGCFGGVGPVSMSVSGCDTIAVGDSIDFSLVKLSVPPPVSFGVYYAGWDRSGFQTSGSSTIHHPWGDVKKISFDHDIPSTPAQFGDVPYTDLEDYHYFSYWWIRYWDIGSTERGSSGSPLYNDAQRIIGILSGGVAKCGDSIDYDEEIGRVIYDNADNFDDYYTKLGVAWNYYGDAGPSLKPWLDPGQTGATSIGGYHPTHVDPPGNIPGSRYRIFPNPASRILRISFLNPTAGSVDFRVFDVSGSLLISGTLDGYTTGEVPVSSLAPGVYLISLEAGVTREFQRFIVAR
jgi:lysyl endopeptidase